MSSVLSISLCPALRLFLSNLTDPEMSKFIPWEGPSNCMYGTLATPSARLAARFCFFNADMTRDIDAY